MWSYNSIKGAAFDKHVSVTDSNACYCGLDETLLVNALTGVSRCWDAIACCDHLSDCLTVHYDYICDNQHMFLCIIAFHPPDFTVGVFCDLCLIRDICTAKLGRLYCAPVVKWIYLWSHPCFRSVSWSNLTLVTLISALQIKHQSWLALIDVISL